MKINYVQHEDGTKLFSFHVHDFKQHGEGKSYIMIDGGFDYTRYTGTLCQSTIQYEIETIREQFTWGQNYDKRGNRLSNTIMKPLKDLTTDHIYGILRYLIKSTEEMNYVLKAKYLIFIEELNYRETNVINK